MRPPLRPQSSQPSRRRAARRITAAAAIGAGHILLLLVLNAIAPKPTPGPPVEPAPAEFRVRLEPPRPAKPASTPGRSARPAPPPPAAARLALHPPPPQQPPSAAAPAPLPAGPSSPDYGRWTVAPGLSPAQGPGLNLAGCTPASLPSLTGAAHEACARRLNETAKNAPALPPAGYQRNVEDQAYAQAVRAWKTSPAMTAHPCPPQDEPAHKLYFDKCSLVNAARAAGGGPLGGSPALKVEFKIKF